ncbi:MAG TPA: metalloregulator ArsR/SmtB family transcription factor [Candidatus Dormibacteraeota bacterium]|jgi:ArsR family transcriptional regulator|nr:metalloregulator ArsR/SmtB family transcription factor [Candidatus Dormibacteraeota bacterium]
MPQISSAAAAAAPLTPQDRDRAAAATPRLIAGAVELLKALASTARLSIVLELGRQERCVHELVDITGMTQPLVSQHLRVLRGAGVVTARRRGRETAYSLTDDHLAHIAADAVRHAEETTR